MIRFALRKIINLKINMRKMLRECNEDKTFIN